jgi:hypothetical protein
MLAPTPNLPALQQPAPKFHDVTVITKKTYACARVEGVPPEEFGIERNAKSICDASYCFHEVARRQSDLIADGFDPEQIKKLPSYSILTHPEALARDTVDENQFGSGDDNLNDASRLIRVTEHYIRMDYEEDKKKPRTSLYRVTTGGEDADILRRKGDDEKTYADDIVEIDVVPFAAMTPVMITHRFFGRSVADLVMDIQRIKTALLRGMLDNLYLHNQPRVEVSESHATPNTVPDLLLSRPGGIVRTKQPGGLQWQTVPDITASVYPALQYFDSTREWRTGVSRQGQGVDANALQNQVATIANQMFNASQAKIKLIARIFAETGIKDLFGLLHGIIRRNGSQAQTVRLRNKWVSVNPREWKAREDMTINVGLGTGSREQQLQQLGMLTVAQEKAIAVGLVSRKNLYNSAKELVKLIGRKDPESFFTPPGEQQQQQPGQPPDPDSQPIEPPEDPKKAEIAAKVQMEQMKAQTDMAALQARNEIEKTQAQADIATSSTKLQNEAAMAERKFQFDMEMETRRFELERELKLLDAQIKQQEFERSQQLEVAKLEQDRVSQEQARQDKANEPKPAPAPDYMPHMLELVGKLAERKNPTGAKRTKDGLQIIYEE